MPQSQMPAHHDRSPAGKGTLRRARAPAGRCRSSRGVRSFRRSRRGAGRGEHNRGDLHFCEFKFYVDSSREGKNTPCENPECGRIIKVPKLTAKAGDWRSEGQHRPSLAKVEQPVPEGAWDAARTGVSEEGIKEIRKAHDRELTPEERRERRIKLAIYSSAMLGIIGIALFFLLRGRGDRQKENLIEKAVKEVAAAETLPQKKTFEAAILRFSAEYRARSVTSKSEFEEAKKQFGQAQKILLDLPTGNPDKELLLGELALVAVEFGGTEAQVKDQQKIAWTDVQRNIRQILDKIDMPEDGVQPDGKRTVPRQDDPWKEKNAHVKSVLKLFVLRQIAPRLIDAVIPNCFGMRLAAASSMMNMQISLDDSALNSSILASGTWQRRCSRKARPFTLLPLLLALFFPYSSMAGFEPKRTRPR